MRQITTNTDKILARCRTTALWAIHHLIKNDAVVINSFVIVRLELSHQVVAK
jgi:hypothetical protein